MRFHYSLFICPLTVFVLGCGSGSPTDSSLLQTRQVGLQGAAVTDANGGEASLEPATGGEQVADPVAARYRQIEDLSEVYQRIANMFDGIDSPEAIDAAAPGLIAQCIEVRSILEQGLSLPTLNAAQRKEFYEGFAAGLGADNDKALQEVARAAVAAFRRIPDSQRWEIVAGEFSKACDVIESHLPQLLEPLPSLPSNEPTAL